MKNKKDENEEKEEKVEKEYITVPKKHGGTVAIVICFIILFALSITSIVLLLMSNNKSSKNEEINFKQDNIDLKYTDPITTQTEGVYITDVSEVVDKVMPSIVAITSKTVINSGNYGPSFRGGSYVTEGAGSGVIIYEDDSSIYILTNYHVVEDSTELSVKFVDEKSYDAKVKGVSERKDIAIVSVDKKSLDSKTLEQIKIATLGSSDELKVGNGIIAIGNALGYGQSVTTGVVSALNREVTTDNYTLDMIQIDAAINGGNSGGALLNSKGEVVGINTVKISSKSTSSSASIEGMGFAIPISDVEDIIKTLIKGENDTDALTLGIEGYMTNSAYNLPEGFYVAKITEGGNADKSELEIGNIITEVDGNEVTSIETFRKILNKKDKGDKITLKVKYASKKEYKEKEITITLN